MASFARLYLATACTAAIAASAFQSSFSPFISLPHTSHAHTSSPRTHDLSMSYYPPNGYGPYGYDYDYDPPPYQSNTRSRDGHPLFSTSAEQAMDQAVDAQVVIEEPPDDEEWIPDRDKVKQGEVINFDPENPKSRPLKNAAAGTDVNDHHNESHFRKNPTGARDMPPPPRPPPRERFNERPPPRERFDDGMPPPRQYMDDRMPPPPEGMPPPMGMDGRMPMDEFEGRDLSQLHSQTRHMNEEYYSQRQTVRRPPPNARRQGGGGGVPLFDEFGSRRNTQDFANTRTPNGREHFINLPDVNDPMHAAFEMEGMPNPFFGEGPSYREEGYLGDSSLKEISMDYSVPITYLADVVASWGVPVPIDPMARLGDMVTGEQAFAMLEAIHTLDIAALHDRYSEDNLMNICEYYDIDMKEAFDFAMKRGWALPFGVRTFLRVEQEEELLDALGGDDIY
ncbi:hypothetical protein ACHAWO_003955 [Cyclotella atomus]|uniref:Uncharacterized protein n=1 Tax=Cyclotella atomus TaxID=382360 RepID=A0ABD3NJ54_9STRA